MEIYLLEVRNPGKNPHFQAAFESQELAKQAMRKYLNDPSCKPKLMIADITPFNVLKDLSILDSVREASNQSSECECGSGYDLVNHKLCHVCGRKVCLNCASMSSPEDIEENKFYCNKHRPYTWSSNQSSTTQEVCECGSSLVTDHHCDNCGRIREQEEK